MATFNVEFTHVKREMFTTTVEADSQLEAELKAEKMRREVLAYGPWSVLEDGIDVAGVDPM